MRAAERVNPDGGWNKTTVSGKGQKNSEVGASSREVSWNSKDIFLIAEILPIQRGVIENYRRWLNGYLMSSM